MSSPNADLLERARLATTSGDADALEQCFEQGLPISAINDHANSDVLIGAMDAQSEAIYKVLLNHGWNIDQTLETVGSALNSACRRLNTSLIKFLLSNGASPNDGAGMYGHDNIVLLIIHSRQDEAFDVLKTFLDTSQGKVDTDECGATLAAVEKSSFDVLKLVVEHGADVNSIADWDTNPSKPDRTPLYAAVDMGDAEKAKYLLEKGADPSWKTPDGKIVAQMAKDKRLSDVVAVMEARED